MAGDLYGYTDFQALSLDSDGVSASPPYTFSSERSLGFHRSAASTIKQSYGTFDLSASVVKMAAISASTVTLTGTLQVASSGQVGTPLQAFSSATCVMPAHVVQGSASSFTIFVWAAARVSDWIGVTVSANPGVSSISSGLIFHSHVTQAGQVELRISNVSTLVQNQSAQTLTFYRLSVL